jgi:LacI family transcriptional regulator
MAKKVTIREVAARAGVSYQTVSRVLNDRPDVAAETRQRVRDIIAELGYRPSSIARSLISNQTFTLGLITADFSDYFFTQVIVGAEAEARKHDYFFMLCSTERNPDEEPEYFKLLTERNVDGILFARPSTEQDSRHMLSLIHQVPLVTTAYYIPGEEMTVVDVDNVDGGFQAARCLLNAGHRHVAMITGPAWKSVSDRSHGYRLALEQGGLPYDSRLVGAGDWSHESGYRAMTYLLERAPHLTAVFAHNDQMAIGAMRAILESGRLIPEDVAVVGYDDIPAASYSYPPLTTIHQPMQDVGRVATQLLIEAINQPDIEPKEVLLKPRLICRDSCGPAAT